MSSGTNRGRSAEVLRFRRLLRQAVADYVGSEGCRCCEGADHSEHQERLARLLGVPRYADGSGYNFRRFESR